MPQDPVNALHAAAQLEPFELSAWPARETIRRNGWVLRFTSGHTHRGNSVATFAFSGSDTEAAISETEREYECRGLPAMFQIASLAEPSDLADRLAARGYEVTSPSFVRISSPRRMRERLPDAGDVVVSATPGEDFVKLVREGSRSPADGNERLEILARVAVPVACVTAFENGVAVACGTGTNTGGHVGINMMRTDAAHRRRGHAQRVLSAIATWAQQQDAARLYLSVEMANAGAVALYERAGFAPACSYRYLRKPS